MLFFIIIIITIKKMTQKLSLEKQVTAEQNEEG